MNKKVLVTALLSAFMVLSLATPAIAQVVYQYGGNIFTSTHSTPLTYNGTGQITAQTHYGNNWTYQGMIVYRRGGANVAGPKYTPVACTQKTSGAKTVALTAWDSLGMGDPVTVFNYDYYTAPLRQVMC